MERSWAIPGSDRSGGARCGQRVLGKPEHHQVTYHERERGRLLDGVGCLALRIGQAQELFGVMTCTLQTPVVGVGFQDELRLGLRVGAEEGFVAALARGSRTSTICAGWARSATYQSA